MQARLYSSGLLFSLLQKAEKVQCDACVICFVFSSMAVAYSWLKQLQLLLIRLKVIENGTPSPQGEHGF